MARNNTQARDWPILAAAATGPAIYAAGLALAAISDVRPFGQAVCFDPAVASHAAPLRVATAVVMALGAVLLLWVTPCLLGVRAIENVAGKRAVAKAWTLVVNSAALVLVCFVLRNTVGIDRGTFLAAWLTWTAVLLVLAGRRGGEPSTGDCPDLRANENGTVPLDANPTGPSTAHRNGRLGVALAVAVATIALGMTLFHREHFVNCFNGDGTEFDQLARSLGQHLLPYWEIEPTEQHGTFIANPTVTNSYWTLGLQLLLGGGELASRLPYWIWWLGIFVIALPMCGSRPASAAVPLALMTLLMSLWYTFYVGYDLYVTDPANPGVPDALFILLLLLSLECLRQGDSAGWVATMVCAALLFYAGWVMFALVAASALVWAPIKRRAMVRQAICGAAVLAAIAAFYLFWGWLTDSLSIWYACVQMEWIHKYFGPEPRLRSGFLFLGYFVLACGGLPVLALWTAFRRGAWDRTLATVVLAYLAIILGAGLKNLHYLAPLAPLTLVLWLRSAESFSGKLARWTAPATIASLALAIWLCWPVARPDFTLNRQLGAMTTFATGSYEEACLWGRVSEELGRQGKIGWDIGTHTWVGYAQLESRLSKLRPLLVTDGSPPTRQYSLLFASPRGGRVYCLAPDVRRWMAEQRPATRVDRWPRVFMPLAVP